MSSCCGNLMPRRKEQIQDRRSDLTVRDKAADDYQILMKQYQMTSGLLKKKKKMEKFRLRNQNR